MRYIQEAILWIHSKKNKKIFFRPFAITKKKEKERPVPTIFLLLKRETIVKIIIYRYNVLHY